MKLLITHILLQWLSRSGRRSGHEFHSGLSSKAPYVNPISTRHCLRYLTISGNLLLADLPLGRLWPPRTLHPAQTLIPSLSNTCHSKKLRGFEKYQPGGYHPILIGDVLQSRYRVVHKLGYGTYSTTWLCRDSQSNKYVAVKVGTTESNTQILSRLVSSILSIALPPLIIQAGQ